MKAKDSSKTILAAALAVLGGPLLAGQAFAQDGSAPTAAEDDTIVVTGQRGAINRSRAAERDANTLVNVITADSIGEFPDQNVAESVRRVPGVNVAREEGEGRTMSVRGLPPAYTSVTVNGARIGSVDGDQSFVQLDSIGSELLDSITVVKSATPDMDGDSIGGAVELSSLSAFTRGENSVSFGYSGFYSEFVDDWSTEGAASFTWLGFDDRIGIAGSLSYSKRSVGGDDLVNDAGLTRYVDLPGVSAIPGVQPGFLRPDEIDHRLEIGVRERAGATLNFEFQPMEGHELFARFQFTSLEDDDGRFQNEYETDQADRVDELNQGPITANGAVLGHRPPTSRTTGGPDIDKQVQLATFLDRVYASSFGSEHDFGALSLNWQLDWSNARGTSNGSYRGRFRIRNINLNTTFGETGYTVTPVAIGGRDPAVLSNYTFDQLRLSDINREDEIVSLRGEVRQEFEFLGRDAFIEFGGRIRDREKFVDTDVFSFNPQDAVFNSVPNITVLRGSLATLPQFTQESSIFPLGSFPDRDAARGRFRELFNAARPLLNQTLGESFGQDYVVNELTTAAYVMANFRLTDELSIITGVRVEDTTLETQGYFLQLDNDDNPIPAPAVQLVNLGFLSKEYSVALPSFHVLWQPTDRIDVRASYNRGLQRPDFGDFANRQTYNFVTRRLEAGNPFLEPLVADQFDLSVGWYPNRNTALQASLFYKDIQDFFVEYSGPYLVSGTPVAQIPLTAGRVSDPSDIEIVLNGESATLLGLELAYSQNLTFLPGLLGGTFVQANATWIDSEASLSSIRPGTFTLPGQPDYLFNLSVGWENDWLTMRLAGNWVGESIETVSSAATIYRDELRNAYFGVDASAQVSLTDNLRLSIEGSNLNEAQDEVVFRGTPETGRIFRGIEQFGRTVTVGLTARF